MQQHGDGTSERRDVRHYVLPSWSQHDVPRKSGTIDSSVLPALWHRVYSSQQHRKTQGSSLTTEPSPSPRPDLKYIYTDFDIIDDQHDHISESMHHSESINPNERMRLRLQKLSLDPTVGKQSSNQSERNDSGHDFSVPYGHGDCNSEAAASVAADCSLNRYNYERDSSREYPIKAKSAKGNTLSDHYDKGKPEVNSVVTALTKAGAIVYKVLEEHDFVATTEDTPLRSEDNDGKLSNSQHVTSSNSQQNIPLSERIYEDPVPLKQNNELYPTNIFVSYDFLLLTVIPVTIDCWLYLNLDIIDLSQQALLQRSVGIVLLVLILFYVK